MAPPPIALGLAYLVYPLRLYGLDLGDLSPLSVAKFVLLYAILAGGFTLLFRRELSPWRYVSIPDALVLARSALLTVGVFLLAVFVLDRAQGLPRSTLQARTRSSSRRRASPSRP